MNQILSDFLKDRAAAGKGKGTIKQYSITIKEFIEYIEKNYFKFIITNLNKIKLMHIKEYLVYLNEKGNAPITRRKKVSELKMFFKYLKSIDKIKVNPTDGLDTIQIKRKIPKYFDKEECKDILNGIGDRNKVRNETIILLFLNTGMRLSELVSLNIEDVSKGIHTIVGKGNKERKIFFSPQIREQIQKYLEIRPKAKTNGLFLSERGTRMNQSSVRQMIKSILASIELEGKPHTLRHTYATQLYQSKKVDLLQLQMLLGHSNISTTTIYTQVEENELKQIAEDSPLNDLIL